MKSSTLAHRYIYIRSSAYHLSRNWVMKSCIFLLWFVQLGMVSGLETLCGQAYGAKQYHMLGIYLQLSWLVLVVTTTLVMPMFRFANLILKALGQEECIAEMAGTIGLWFISVIYSFIISFSCQIFLQSQSKNMIITYLATLSLSIHISLMAFNS